MLAKPIGVSTVRSSNLRPGWFVEPHDRRRLAKVRRFLDDRVEVEFFHSTSRSEIEVFGEYSVLRTYLSRQTRVYVQSTADGRWLMGRVRDFQLQDDGSVTYEVRMPNKRDFDVPEARVYARCLASAADPAEVLAAGAGETQRFHDTRWAARATLATLRGAACGLTGLTSASVEIVPHQVEAIRRVLTDPLQRYLLADEVGLGKTVEAGAVIRQVLIDEPGRRIAVAVPEALVAQWCRELDGKFGLSTGPADAVHLVAHGDVETLAAPFDLLVVDEAHRVAAGSAHGDALARLVRSSAKLLLLSATPVLGQEEALLAMLRWLDPARWDQETPEAFRVHVAKRQDYGRLLLGLRPEGSAFALRSRANIIKAQFVNDPTAVSLADDLLAALDRPEARGRACAALAEHVADAYRIHNRIIRARRTDLEGWEFKPRGPANLRIEEDGDERLGDMAASLEDWRASASSLALDHGEATRLAERYCRMIEAAGRSVDALATLLPTLLPSFKGEDALLEGLGRSVTRYGGDGSRAEFVALVVERELGFLRQRGTANPKTVVFATDAEACAAIATALAVRLGAPALAGGGEAGRFEREPGCIVAVLDERGEEGLNLSFADSLVHADLPFSAARMEQRTGRADRFGRRKGPIRHCVIIPEWDGDEDGPWGAWLNLLRDGFGLFDRSLSDVQFTLTEIEDDAKLRLFRSGAAGLRDYRDGVRSRVAAERDLLDEQYALDRLAANGREAVDGLARRIEEAEEDEEALASSVRRLLADLLQFRLVRGDRDDVFAVHWGPDTLLPERPWRAVFEGALGKPVTWRRQTAVSRPGVALLRPGSTLVNGLEALLDWDDRGSAFATWRLRTGAGGPGRETLAFRLCWLVEPDVAPESLLAAEDPAGLRRRASGYLRPWTVVQHLDPDGSPVTDPALLACLMAPYRPAADETSARDYNLGSRPAWLDGLISPSEFARLCQAVRDEGLRQLRAGPDWAARVATAAESAESEARKRRRRLAARLADHPDPTAARDLELDALLLRAVREPRARLDALGAFVVAGYVPRESGT